MTLERDLDAGVCPMSTIRCWPTKQRGSRPGGDRAPVMRLGGAVGRWSDRSCSSRLQELSGRVSSVPSLMTSSRPT